jgi:carbonic anhydrase
VLQKLIESLRPADFRSSHALFELPSRGRPSRTLLIACSDLAIDPFTLIPTNHQDLYVLQNFGNLAPPPDPEHYDATDVERAVALYQAEDIVVCGHAHCGVMRTLLSSDKYGLPAPFASRLRPAQKTKQIVAAHCGGLRGERLLTDAARVNVLVQLENLRATPSIAERLGSGELHLHGWLYTAGVITAYDPHRAEFVDLAQ